MDRLHDARLLSHVSYGTVGDLSGALNELGRHAAAMDQADEYDHDACVYCETMKLFSRVADFGFRLRTRS